MRFNDPKKIKLKGKDGGLVVPVLSSTPTIPVRSITIDSSKCGTEDSSNFPILFSGTYSYLATTSNGGSVVNENGYDIAFYLDQERTTLLDFERVSWEPTTGECQFWVKISTLDVDADTVIYLSYGDSSITTDQQDAVNTWDSSYGAVWHLEESSNGTADEFKDSTSNASHGVGTGYPIQSTGQIGNAQSFDRTNPDSISMGTRSSLIPSNNMICVEAWINPTTLVSEDVICKMNGIGNYTLFVHGGNGGDLNLMPSYNVNWGIDGPNTNISNGNWYHIAATCDGTNNRYYVNGVLTDTISNSGTLGTSSLEFLVGGPQVWGNEGDWHGLIDELRISTGTIRATSWFLSSYNNQNSPSTFYTISDEL